MSEFAMCCGTTCNKQLVKLELGWKPSSIKPQENQLVIALKSNNPIPFINKIENNTWSLDCDYWIERPI